MSCLLPLHKAQKRLNALWVQSYEYFSLQQNILYVFVQKSLFRKLFIENFI